MWTQVVAHAITCRNCAACYPRECGAATFALVMCARQCCRTCCAQAVAAKISAARALAQRLSEEKAAVAVAARASADGSLDEDELVQCDPLLSAA